MWGDSGKRALFLFPTDHMGGAERVTRTIAKEAATSGVFGYVHCFILSRENTGTLSELVSLRNVTLHYTGARSERGGLLAMVRLLMKSRFDLVFSSHTHINALCSIIRRAGLLHTRKLVARESTLIFERKFGYKGPLLRALYWLYGAQDMIICQTGRMQQSFNKHTNNRLAAKSVVLPNPVEFDRIERAGRASTDILNHIPATAMKIVWCGRLVPVKAPARAVETLRALHDLGHRNAHLIMIGDGPLASQVCDAVRRLELDRFVTLCGYQSNPLAIMARCDLGLLTSEMEGFPNVILEMLAAGARGVVATDCAGDLKKTTGVHVCEPGDPAALAARLAAIAGLARPIALHSMFHSRSPAAFFQRILST